MVIGTYTTYKEAIAAAELFIKSHVKRRIIRVPQISSKKKYVVVISEDRTITELFEYQYEDIISIYYSYGYICFEYSNGHKKEIRLQQLKELGVSKSELSINLMYALDALNEVDIDFVKKRLDEIINSDYFRY